MIEFCVKVKRQNPLSKGYARLPLLQAEAEAQAAKRGLWADKAHVAPWASGAAVASAPAPSINPRRFA